MAKKLDPDSTASHKSLLLFSLLLFSGRRHFLIDLMERFNCSKPTITRLMETIELSGAAKIERGTENRRLWYQLRVPPGKPYVSFTREEVEKLVLCRDLLEHLLPDGIERIVSEGLGKISTLMDKVEVAERGQTTASKGTRMVKGRIDYTPFQPHIDSLLKAARDHTVCAVTYKTPGKEERVFEIVPVRLMVDEEVLNVEGWRVMEKGKPEIRHPMTLAVHRIRECVATRRKLDACPDWPEEEGAFGLTGGTPFPARVIFSNEFSEHIRERIWSKDQTITELPDGSVELKFTATSEYYLRSWLLGFGSGAELLEPEHLREVMLDEARAMFEMYESEEAK